MDKIQFRGTKDNIYSFVFQCSGCGKISNIEEEYDETKEYECPFCKIRSIIRRKDVKYKAKRHPCVFMCPKCSSVQRTYDYVYRGEIDGYEVSEYDCPNCGHHIVDKYETVIHQMQCKEYLDKMISSSTQYLKERGYFNGFS